MIEKKIYSIELEGSQKFNENINKVSDSFGKLENTSTSLKKELREAIQELQTLPENSERFQELSKRAGELKDQIGDINQRVNILASDTQKLDAFINVAQGITAGFSVATGALSIFGVESEKAQQVLVKIQSAIAILNGLQTIQNFLNKDSAASIAFANVQRTIANATESKSVIVKGAATAAQWLLNTAMSANPIGLVIVAIGALIAIYTVFGDKLKEIFGLSKSEKEINEELIKQGKEREEQLEREIQLRARVVNALRDFKIAQNDNKLLAMEILLFGKLNSENLKEQNDAKRQLLRTEIEYQKEKIKELELAKREVSVGKDKAKAINDLLQAELALLNLEKELADIDKEKDNRDKTEIKRAKAKGVELIKVAKDTKKEIDEVIIDPNLVIHYTTLFEQLEAWVARNEEEIKAYISEIQNLTNASLNAVSVISQIATDTQVSFYEGQIKQLDEQAEALNSQLDELQTRTAEIEAEFDNARGQRRQRLLDDLKKQGEAEQALAKKQEDIAKKKADLEKKQSDARLKQAKLEAQLNAASVSVNTAAAIAVAALNGAKNDPTGGILTAINIAALSATLVATLASAAAKTKQINKELDGFADGGYTGKGGRIDRSGHRVAGVTHDNEYVVPTRVLANPKGAQMVKQLDRMRKGFADGGFTGADFGALNQSATDRTVNDLSTRPIYVAVTDINLANERMDKIKMATVI